MMIEGASWNLSQYTMEDMPEVLNRNIQWIRDETTAKIAELEAKLARVRELCYREGYITWDDSMVFALNGFGAHNSEELKKWEAMHGHDIRLKCYAEFGCQLLVDPFDIIRALDEESE
jgi:hypothetical protein